ncbi:MAG: 50S ribosomal protein L11 methyltransferase [Syntrophobacteraceae bacterium]
MLRVYEITGEGRPVDVPAGGLEGVWPEPPFYYLFYRKEAPGAVSKWLELHPDFRMTGRYELPYEKWQDISHSQLSLGVFDIAMSACPVEKPGRIRLLLDPGVVFGSGVHPTTHGCLLALSEIFASTAIRTVVDFGAGTGILAIACALAGAQFALAIDRNPMAIENGKKNARANGVEDKVGFVQAEGLECVGLRPDLLVMNVEWPVQEKILSSGQWKRARRIVLAGFLPGMLEAVKAFAGPGFSIERVTEIQGWPTVSLVANE